MPVKDFYESIYNITPAHADDVHAAIIDNPNLEVITPAGGPRRKPNTIAVNDVIKLKRQISFFPMFYNAGANDKSGDKRSEERRVGKERVSTWRSWWAPYQ